MRLLLVILICLLVFNRFGDWMGRHGFGKLPGDLRFRIAGRDVLPAAGQQHRAAAGGQRDRLDQVSPLRSRERQPKAISAAGTASITTWKLPMLRSVSFSCRRICRPVAWGLSCEVWASEASVTA